MDAKQDAKQYANAAYGQQVRRPEASCAPEPTLSELALTFAQQLDNLNDITLQISQLKQRRDAIIRSMETTLNGMQDAVSVACPLRVNVVSSL